MEVSESIKGAPTPFRELGGSRDGDCEADSQGWQPLSVHPELESDNDEAIQKQRESNANLRNLFKKCKAVLRNKRMRDENEDDISPVDTQQPYEDFLSFSLNASKVVETKQDEGVTKDDATDKDIDAVSKVITGNEFPWFQRISPSTIAAPFLIRLHFECMEMLKWMNPTPLERLNCKEVLYKVGIISKMLWNGSEAYEFGSWATGLTIPGGDIDICILKVPGDVIMSLKLLAHVVCKLNLAQSIELITTARVPILKYVDRETGILADISINQKSSIQTTNFIVEQMVKFKHIRPLVLLVKLFLKLRGLNSTYTGGVGSFLLSCMVISFLQLSAASAQPIIYRRSLLGHLLIDFFFYWGYERKSRLYATSVRGMGHMFPKTSRQAFCESPITNLFSIENPFDFATDMGSTCFNSRAVCDAFRKAFLELKSLEKEQGSKMYPLSTNSILKTLYDPTHPIFSIRKKPSEEPTKDEGSIEDLENGKLEALRIKAAKKITERIKLLDEAADEETAKSQLAALDTRPGTYIFELKNNENQENEE